MRLDPPTSDDLALLNSLAAKGYHDDVTLVQYVAWAAATGLLEALASGATDTERALVDGTPLTEAGVDALVGVLATIGVIVRDGERLALSPASQEYLVPSSPYFMGESLFVSCDHTLPEAYVEPSATSPMARVRRGLANRLTRLAGVVRGDQGWTPDDWRLGSEMRLVNQHSRNLPGGVAAAQLAVFDEATCIADIGGGTGTFAIPIAQRLPGARVVLTDLPDAVDGVRRFLDRYDETNRIEVVAMDMFDHPWPLPVCDAIFFGNVIHIFGDEEVREVAEQSRKHLDRSGVLVFHELVWNTDKTGPLKTALFNATMRTYAGKQRTVAELQALLDGAGFTDLFAHDTAGGFTAVGGRVPAPASPRRTT